MNTPHNQRDLAELVARTISALDHARLPLDLPGAEQLNENRRRLRTQLATRIRPHLLQDGLPTVVVLGGSSGAGKSTLFNSLLGEDLSPASVIRPTTRTPIIAIHPDDWEMMTGHAICEMGEAVSTPNAISGMVLVDAPDLDSVDEHNRELSRRLLDSADLWLFVTTASRYGDAIAWRTLTDAHERGMSTAVVLNRVPARSIFAIRSDLMKRMDEIGMGEDPLLIVPDAGPRDAMLDAKHVVELRDWLAVIASTRVGKALVDRTSQAMLPELRTQLLELSDAVDMHANAIQDLGDRARAAVEQPNAKLSMNARMGRFGQGAPSTAWLTFASTGGALAPLATGGKPSSKTQARDKAVESVFSGVRAAIRVGLEQGIVTARTAVEQTWRADMVNTEEFLRAGGEKIDADALIAETIDGWHKDLLELVGPRVNPWFSREGSAFLMGAAAGGVAGAERALERLFMKDLLKKARSALAARVEAVVDAVAAAYTSVLDEIPVGNGRELRLRAAEYLDRV